MRRRRAAPVASQSDSVHTAALFFESADFPLHLGGAVEDTLRMQRLDHFFRVKRRTIFWRQDAKPETPFEVGFERGELFFADIAKRDAQTPTQVHAPLPAGRRFAGAVDVEATRLPHQVLCTRMGQ